MTAERGDRIILRSLDVDNEWMPNGLRGQRQRLHVLNLNIIPSPYFFGFGRQASQEGLGRGWPRLSRSLGCVWIANGTQQAHFSLTMESLVEVDSA